MKRLLPLFLLPLASAMFAADSQPLVPAELVRNAQALMVQAQQDNIAYEVVSSLTTEVGPRLAGTEAEARARDWALAKLKAVGLKQVRVEPFTLPVWERGIERAEVVAPFPQPLVITALGGSTSTGHQGVEGDIVRFPHLQALRDAAPDTVRGRIVFVDEPMTRTQDGLGYGVASGKRREAAYIAEQMGALAVLIRSVGTSSHRFAHTGQMRRVIEHGDSDGVPAAALAAPDADQLTRMIAAGHVPRVHLLLTPEQRPAGESGNVIGELRGREFPDDIILIGAHLDSWDLSPGAVDDGAGVGIVLAAIDQLRKALPKGPRRTIRVVLFGAEEVGLAGAKAYAEQHADTLPHHILGSESDFGAGRVWRFDAEVPAEHRELAVAIGRVLAPLGIAPGLDRASGGPDMKFVREGGVPTVTLKQDGWDYFDLHHTPNDTLDKIDPASLSQNVAAWAGFLYLVSELDRDFRD